VKKTFGDKIIKYVTNVGLPLDTRGWSKNEAPPYDGIAEFWTDMTVEELGQAIRDTAHIRWLRAARRQLRHRVGGTDRTSAACSVFKVSRGYLSMFTTKQMIPRVLGMLLAACLLVAPITTSFDFSLPNFRPPPLYLIEGYLDRAPQDAEIVDRIDITAQGRRHTLLITRYGMPGETGLDRYLSRVMAESFAIQGASEDVERLAGAPSGTKIAGTFAAYTGSSPWLLIVDLTAPAPKP
jgi:hypothetical protein